MSKKLVHWAKKESFEEAAIKVAAEKIGIEEGHAAIIIDNALRAYREAVTDIRVPDVFIGSTLRFKPNINKLKWRISKLILEYKAKLRSIHAVNLYMYPIKMVYKRLKDFKCTFTEYQKNAEALRWKNEMKPIMEKEIARRKQVVIDNDGRYYNFTESRFKRFIVLKTMLFFKNKKRAKKFRLWKN